MAWSDTVNSLVESLNSQAQTAAEEAVPSPPKTITRYHRVSPGGASYTYTMVPYDAPNPNYKNENELSAERGQWIQENYGNRLMGAQFVANQAEEYERMKTEAAADREDILGEIEAWGAGLNSDFVEAGVNQERAAWEGKIASTRDQLVQNAAAQGRTLSPWLMAEVTGRLAAQANEAISLRRMELERELADRKMQFIQAKDSVYANTDRQMMNPMQAYSLMQQLGAADAK